MGRKARAGSSPAPGTNDFSRLGYILYSILIVLFTPGYGFGYGLGCNLLSLQLLPLGNPQDEHTA